MTKEFLNYYKKNIDQYSKPLKGSVEFLIGQKIKIFLWGCTNKQEKLAIDLLRN